MQQMQNNITFPKGINYFNVLPNSKPVIDNNHIKAYIQLIENVIFIKNNNDDSSDIQDNIDTENNNNNYNDIDDNTKLTDSNNSKISNPHSNSDSNDPNKHVDNSNINNNKNVENVNSPTTLKGTVILKVSKPLKIKSIHLRLVGVLRVDWPEGVFDASDNIITYQEKELVDADYCLYDFRHVLNHNDSNISIKNGGRNLLNAVSTTDSAKRRHSTTKIDSFIFKPNNSYNYTFEFIIPSNLPETIKVEYGKVEYKLFLDIEKFSKRSNSITGNNHAASLFKNYLLSNNINSDTSPPSKNGTNPKAIISGSLPVKIIKTQSDYSLDESESINIAKTWKDSLFYDILIGSKEAILDAYLPIQIYLLPLEKGIILHRIRIYLSEKIDYYSINKKSSSYHRSSKQKSFLLAEHNGPNLKYQQETGNNNNNNTNTNHSYLNPLKIINNNDNKPVKVKDLGNLLLNDDDISPKNTNADHKELTNKLFEYQIFVPKVFNSFTHLNPNTSIKEIQINHWIRIEFRISLPNKDNIAIRKGLLRKKTIPQMKHFEVQIDTPINILDKLCSHANTLLPNYYESELQNRFTSANNSNNIINTNSNNLLVPFPSKSYHESNRYFPEEVYNSNMISSNIHSLDLILPSVVIPDKHNKNKNKINHAKNINLYDYKNIDSKRCSVPLIDSPKLMANIYQPTTLSMELTSSQAIPSYDHFNRSNDNNMDIFDYLLSAQTQTQPPSYDDIIREKNNHISKVNTKSYHVDYDNNNNDDNDNPFDINAEVITTKLSNYDFNSNLNYSYRKSKAAYISNRKYNDIDEISPTAIIKDSFNDDIKKQQSEQDITSIYRYDRNAGLPIPIKKY